LVNGEAMQERSVEGTTDQALMMAVRDGDVDKLGVLFERYHRQLFSFLVRLTGNRPLSEDLVQEVFVRLLKYRHTYRGDSQFTTWMFQIARNARVDMMRRSPREDTSIDECVQEFVSLAPTPAERAEKSEDVQMLLDAVSRLPEDRREVLLLRGVHGLKFEEIALALRCSVNTIKGRAFRAIRELRISLSHLNRERSI
jgi:RNA polymerase sigma factor (sigma-70 family)